MAVAARLWIKRRVTVLCQTSSLTFRYEPEILTDTPASPERQKIATFYHPMSSRSPAYLDQHFAEEDYIVLEAETYTEAIKLRYRDCERVVKHQVADWEMG